MMLAITADALQIVVFPLLVQGALSPADEVLDLAVAAVLVRLLGWHWEFLPAFAAELVPGVDLVPFWTLAVANVYRKWKQITATAEETREQRPALKTHNIRKPRIRRRSGWQVPKTASKNAYPDTARLTSARADGDPGAQFPSRSGSCWKARSFTSCSCKVRGRSGYKNVLQNPSIQIDARGVSEEFRAVPLTDTKAVKSVIEQFREKYGVKDVKRYYSKFDVAVLVELG